MDNQNNDLKPLNLTNLSQVDLSKIINSDITKIPIQSYQPQLNIKTPNYNLLKKKNQNRRKVSKVGMKEIQERLHYSLLFYLLLKV